MTNIMDWEVAFIIVMDNAEPMEIPPDGLEPFYHHYYIISSAIPPSSSTVSSSVLLYYSEYTICYFVKSLFIVVLWKARHGQARTAMWDDWIIGGCTALSGDGLSNGSVKVSQHRNYWWSENNIVDFTLGSSHSSAVSILFLMPLVHGLKCHRWRLYMPLRRPPWCLDVSEHCHQQLHCSMSQPFQNSNWFACLLWVTKRFRFAINCMNNLLL